MAIETIRNHTAWIMDRGGLVRRHQLVDITRIIWNRVRDDISTATVNISVPTYSPQKQELAELVRGTGRFELAIWRGAQRVWEGPITLVTFLAEGVVIEARDVMHYAARTIMHAAYDNSYPNTGYVTTRAKTILDAELARKEALSPAINVVPHIVEHHTATDAETSRSTVPYQYTVWEHVDDLAAKSGLDYTVVGRAIHLWDTHQDAMGYTPDATRADFHGDVYVSIYGMELGTYAVVTDGLGTWGGYGGNDPFYGEVERLATAYDENATAAPTQAELESQAFRNLDGRNPTPLQVRVPDGSSINMNGIFTVENLVPGVFIPLRAEFNAVTISQLQKLNAVRFIEEPEGETVTVTLFPAAGSDEPEGS